MNAKFRLAFNPLFLAFFYFTVLGTISVILGQDANWDLLNYHFYNPYLLLKGHFDRDLVFASGPTYLNPLIDVPIFVWMYYLKFPPIVFGFLLGGFHGFNQFFIHLLTDRALSKVSETYRLILSVIVATTSVFAPGFLSELGTSFGDSTTSVFVLAGLFLIADHLSQSIAISHRVLITAGIIFGMAAGLKLTNAAYCIGIVVGINFLPNSWKEKFLNLVIIIPSIIVGFFLTAGYWMIFLWIKVGNPIFPFANKIFQSPYIDNATWKGDMRFLPRDIWQQLFYPFYFIRTQNLVSEIEFRDSRLAIVYLLIIVTIGIIIYRYLMKRPLIKNNELICFPFLAILIPFTITSYFFWLRLAGIYRYLIVLELLAPVLIILTIAYLYPHRKTIVILTLVVFALIIVTFKPMNWGRVSWSGNFLGIDSQALARYQNSVIIVSETHPFGYLVPSFPDNNRFLRIDGFPPRFSDLVYQKARDIIQSTPDSSIYYLGRFLEYKDDLKNRQKYDETLKLYQLKLTLNLERCRSFQTSIGEYWLCKLSRDRQ